MRIVEISAVWCSSCLVMKKIWKKVKEQYSNLEWIEYDLDFSEEANSYQVGEKLPVLIFFKNETEQSRLIGEKRLEEVEKWIEENIGA